MNSNVEFIVDKKRVRPEGSEVFRLWCDNALIKKLTDFEPKVSIREGLQKTIDWIEKPENLRTFQAEAYNV